MQHVMRRLIEKACYTQLSIALTLACCTVSLGGNDAQAQRITNQVAIFSALDKVTARIRKLEIPINETVQFGSLKVTPRACYSRPPEVRPKTSTFVQVDEVLLNGDEKRLFSGWMFAESPALNAVEHPVFDVWLTSCGQPQNMARANTCLLYTSPSPRDA